MFRSNFEISSSKRVLVLIKNQLKQTRFSKNPYDRPNKWSSLFQVVAVARREPPPEDVRLVVREARPRA